MYTGGWVDPNYGPEELDEEQYNERNKTMCRMWEYDEEYDELYLNNK